MEMIAYARTPDGSTDGESENYLDIHNAGIHCYRGTDAPRIVRPKGRKDFQLLYVHGGKLLIQEPNGSAFTADSHCILYAPYEPQDYQYIPGEDSEICWIHFNGVFAERILCDVNLREKITAVTRDESALQLFKKIIFTLQRKESNYTALCNSFFLQLLCVLSANAVEVTEDKNATVAAKARSNRCYKEIFPAIAYIHENPHQHFTLELLANICCLSKPTFIRTFTKAVGISPIAYAIKQKLDSSLYYLMETNLSIANIADKFGFESPFYYSALFKKRYGCSPSAYRKHAEL